ncbi:MAG: lipoxygenase family protein, partial [Pseudomonadota bacterium]
MKADIPLSASDLHSRITSALISDEAHAWQPRGPESVGLPKQMTTLEKYDVAAPFIAIPAIDEDGKKLTFSEQATHWALQSLPLADDNNTWSNPIAATEQIELQYGDVLPKPNVQWQETTSDKTMSLLAFQGLGSHRLERVNDDPDAAYRVDLSWMVAFPVREGFERYGACAFFNRDRQPVRIYTAYDDKTHHPSDPTWEAAKWCWRCSLFVGVTVTDHFGSVHYLASNLLVTATREQLPPEHPFRRLLTPFIYGTADVNRDAYVLLSPKQGLAHRTFAFTYDGIVRCLLKGVEFIRLQTFPEALTAAGTDSLGDEFPYATDGLALYEILENYVRDYLAIYLPDDSAVEDPAIRHWWSALTKQAPNLGLKPLQTAEQLIRVTTHFMFTVTGFHGQVGDVVAYTRDPGFVGAKIRAGQTIGDVQSTVQMINITITTGLIQPPMIGDYRHTLPDQNKDQALQAFETYQ